MQIASGAVYAWSVFRIPLSRRFGWSIAQATAARNLSMLGKPTLQKKGIQF